MQNIKISFENAFFIASEDIVTFQPKSIDIFLISQRKHIYGTHFFFFYQDLLSDNFSSFCMKTCGYTLEVPQNTH